MIKVALLTTDSREHFKDYANAKPYFGTAPEALLEGFKLMPDDIEVHVVSCLQKAPISSPSKLADNIYYHALHVPNIGWMKTAYQGCIRSVRRRLREIEPAIVHGQGTERDCAVCAVSSGYPSVLTLHGNMRLIARFLRSKPFTYYWFATKLERYCLAKTCGVIAISSYTQSNVAPYTHHTWLVPNAVHSTFFKVPRQPSLLPRILCIANIGTRKNQIGLIKALDSLAKDSSIKVAFAGSSSQTDPYCQEFHSMVNTRAWCEYLGPLNRNALQAEMSRATMGILPSYEDNCPMVVLEAAAAGLPFAASRVGGVPDLVEHNVTGLLFDPSAPDQIAAAVLQIISDAHLARSLAERALTSCRQRSDPEAVARQHLAIYRTTISE
jgi:glycosyltransferase involved in cell wall biosynthesis